MTRICFSQNFEDVVLWRALSHVQNGRYLDIGAQDPIIDSVSRSFYLAGWRGVHVEPTPQYAEALRADRPDEVVIEAAVGTGSDPLPLNVFEGTGLSTADQMVAAAHSSANRPSEIIMVSQITLASLLDRFTGQDLHWLKIDVEGMEDEVLASWGTSPVRPWIVVIEAIDPVTAQATDSKWRSLIEKRGYNEVLFDGVNRFFVAAEHAGIAATISAPANCLDDFVVPWHHWLSANAVHQFSSQVAAANSAAQVAASESERARAALDNAIADRERVERERDYLSSSLDNLQNERSVLSRALELLEQEFSDRRLEAERLRLANAEASRRAQSLINALQNSQEQLTNSENRREAIAADAARLQFAVKEREIALERLATELERISKERTALGEQVTAQNDRLAQAERIATLAARMLKPWYAQIINALSGKARQIRKDLSNSLEKWSTITSHSTYQHQSTHQDGTERMELFAYDRRDPYQRANTLAELCRFADRDFIRCAFVTILGRQPDPDGEDYYLRRLRAGDSMLSILWTLRRSKEGCSHDPGIAGLDRALRQHHNANRPLIGWLVRLFTGREGNSPTERRLRIITNMLATEHNLAAARSATSNHLQVVLAHRIDEVEKQLKLAVAGHAMTPRQIAQAESSGDTQWEATLTSVLSGH